MNIEEQVKTANKAVYDNAAGVDLLASDISIINSLEQKRIERIIKIISQGGRVKIFLDVGTGYANVLNIAREYFNYSLGCDLSFYPLSVLKKERSGLPLVCCDATSLAFKNNTFDCVCLFSVLHHIVDYNKVIDEAARVIKKNGYLYIDHDNNHFFTRYYRPFLKFIRLLSFRRREGNLMLANFHIFQSQGLNPELIKHKLIALGFSEINLEYRFTSNPRLKLYNAFILSLLKLVCNKYPFKSCYTHFSIVAKK